MMNYSLLLFSISITCTVCKAIILKPSDEFHVEDVANIQRSGIQTLPLLTYHELKQRRMLEMGLDEYEMEYYLDSLPSKPYRPSSRRTSLEVGGLYQGYGTHYVDLWVGTPAQRQTVIVDTGSGVTAFPCSECKDCGKNYHASPFFVEDKSVSFHKMQCDSCQGRSSSCQSVNKDDEHCKISVSYQEGSSWTAYQAEDLTYLGGPHDIALNTQSFQSGNGKHLGSSVVDEDPADAASFRFPLRFGCQTKVTGLFKTQLADGIMGMCIQDEAFWHQMYNANMIDAQRFSLCFSREPDADSDGTVAGAVTMGGTDTNLHSSPMVFAEGHLAGSIMHGITMRRLYFMKGGQYDVVNATKVNTVALSVSADKLNRGRVILDSGTTDTYFVRDIADAFKSTFKSLVGVDYNSSGMKLSDEQIDLLPSLIVQLNGYSETDQQFDPSNPDALPGLAGNLDPDNPNDVLVVIPPNHYVDYNPSTDKYIPRISPTEYSGTVLGANFMAGHDILFDIPENKRIGFAVSDCDYGRLIDGTHVDEDMTQTR